MRTSFSALLAVCIPAIFLTACNGQTAATPAMLPNGASGAQTLLKTRHITPHDESANDLHAGGATFPAYAYNLGNQPVGLYTAAQQPPGDGSLFAAAPTTGTIYYCLTGSGAGRKGFEGASVDSAAPPTGACAPIGATATGFGARQDPLDFAGSDVAMTSSDYTNYVTNRNPASGVNYGTPFEFPIVGGPIVYGYRQKDFPALKGAPIQFSEWTMCAIANGTVSNWDDPAITKDNGRSVTGRSSEPIKFYFRSDGSGTSFNFVFHLNAVCNRTWSAPYNAAPYQSGSRTAAWPYGVPIATDVWPGPGSAGVPNTQFVGENGNPGVVAAIQATQYSVGYAEGAWVKAANPAVAQASMQNGFHYVTVKKGKHSTKEREPYFISPDDATAVAKAFKRVTAALLQPGYGADGNPLTDTNTSVADPNPGCALYLPASNFTHAPPGAYPINAVSYLLFYQHNQGFHSTDKQALIDYLDGADTTTSPTSAAVESSLEYVPLSKSIDTAIQTAASSGAAGGTACFQAE